MKATITVEFTGIDVDDTNGLDKVIDKLKDGMIRDDMFPVTIRVNGNVMDVGK